MDLYLQDKRKEISVDYLGSLVDREGNIEGCHCSMQKRASSEVDDEGEDKRSVRGAEQGANKVVVRCIRVGPVLRIRVQVDRGVHAPAAGGGEEGEVRQGAAKN